MRIPSDNDQLSIDPLTGLHNRRQLEKFIKEIITRNENNKKIVAVLIIDLDNFREVNHRFGSRIADLMLVSVAERLKNMVKPDYYLARIGGDEFAFILTEIDHCSDATYMAQQIMRTLINDHIIEGQVIRIRASIGIACYPSSLSNQDNIIANADIAVHHAKAIGRNNYQYFTEELFDWYTQQFDLGDDLKFALEKNQLHLTYQPIYDLTTNKIISLETLLCWQHPNLGYIAPDTFIPIAEEFGLIGEIGDWVFKTACDQFSKLDTKKFSEVKLAINISSRQILQKDFYQKINKIIEASGLKPTQIELELTETMLLHYADNTFNETINKIQQAGIDICIDDFGTGYSSLVRLKYLPVSTIKIDKSFIHDAMNSKISALMVESLIMLGKKLGMNVTAEGIETEEQLQFLIERKCPQGQGFYLSKAHRIEEIKKLFG